jgi:Arc/MetJ-type ribon-helix-helix transcriptional regulator
LNKRKNRDGYSERLSVGFTPEQMRRLEEILRARARQGRMQNKTDLIRDALNLYLSHQDDIPGTRAAITRKLEGRLDAVEEQLQRQSDLLEKMVAYFKRKREA